MIRRVSRQFHEHQPVRVAPVAARVWHANRQCCRSNCALRVGELPPCCCADGALLNVVGSDGTILVDDLREWLRMAATWLYSLSLFGVTFPCKLQSLLLIPLFHVQLFHEFATTTFPHKGGHFQTIH